MASPYFEAEITYEFDLDGELQNLIRLEKGDGPYSDVARLSLWEAVNIVAGNVVAETPVNTGHLRQKISGDKRVDYAQHVWSGVIGDGGVEYGAPVEYGRKPGKMPPVDDIAYWILRTKQKWMQKTKSGKQIPMTVEQMAWALARHIAKNGTQGAFMFLKGVEASRTAVDQVWDRLMEDWVRLWERGK